MTIEERKNRKVVGHECPVCHKYIFGIKGSGDICEVCGWMDDVVQNEDEDECCGFNDMSLKMAREAYKNGEKIH